MKFEWDENKKASNLAKHGVDFEDAAKVFYDDNRIESLDDREDYGEDRIRVIGTIRPGLLSSKLVVLLIYTDRDGNIRIISARRATREEKEEYYGNR
ncbi:MAG: BrnT family toxin [Rickettsiales bacterium]|jgi:uncharacterized DUF497 family protein|nr:BrnT family toxin [Rickettsiales bacterium]